MIQFQGVEKWSKEYRALYHKRRRATRRRLGRCEECNVKCDTGTRCADCKRRACASASKIVYERKNSGLCTRCKKPIDRDGWACVACRELMNAARRRLRDERRDAFECIHCGDPLELTNRQKRSGKGFSCRTCLDRRRLHAKR